ncbi:GDP-mannose 4,6-dehydratase [candidate division KSB3 bacterium]|uniref:GDP-mannose 4,6-dehydratase n=1 Tax=candidate division KSB3 bacterium TaxID=2044937 RepID=A0A2G6EB07_9BACT|nr:MAG: GDP-mannose 4,6-dehydratase [candidate division KSB3 bacterium]PIE30807.1 MAG: GDP-mannose 4,6-dehydratase [candidate division KSB3 bacterium]
MESENVPHCEPESRHFVSTIVTVLITGATGFAGSHMCEYLLEQGAEVYGTYIYQEELGRFPERLRNNVHLRKCDLAEIDQVRALFQGPCFDRVYNLAAISSVHQSWSKGQDVVLRVNLYGWLNLIGTLHEFCPRARVLMVSSGEVYGIVPEDRQPVSEQFPLQPINPYADSKAAQEMFCYQYLHRHQSQIVIVRPFNHTGPRQSPSFVCSDFAKQIAEIEKGLRPPLMSVGNLEARRDFSDVRDMVRAYHAALEQAPIGIPMNAASGKAWSIQQVLDILLAHSRVSVEVQQSHERLRPSDVPLMLGDASLLRQHTGWEPAIPFEKTLLDTLEYWRTQLA